MPPTPSDAAAATHAHPSSVPPQPKAATVTEADFGIQPGHSNRPGIYASSDSGSGSNASGGAGSGDSGNESTTCGRALSSEYLFYFGDPYDICKALGITNRLTGCVTT